MGKKLVLGFGEGLVFNSPHQILSVRTLRELVANPDSTVGEPFWFGLGFAKIRISPTQVLNFWPGKSDSLVEDSPELHTHRYRFTSKILRGKLISTVYESGQIFPYDMIPKDIRSPVLGAAERHTHLAETVTCRPDGSDPEDRPLIGYCTPRALQVSEHMAGTEYTIWKDTFHRTVAVEPTVTLLERPAHYETDTATVLRPTHKSAVCAYQDTAERDPWQVIESVLAAPMGYHTKPLPKGTVGEPSGILEEVLEFMDAVSPDRKVRNPVLELCELSDTVGSIEAYLERYFPALALGDLREMARATRESFQRGDRG